jgi:activating signal cointegrator complex subunit 2
LGAHTREASLAALEETRGVPRGPILLESGNMASHAVMSLPLMAPFPQAAWKAHMVPEEWTACLDAWIFLAEAHLSFSVPGFQRISVKDDSIRTFLLSYMSETALSPDIASFNDPLRWKRLWKQCFLLSNRLFHVEKPPGDILKWEFLSDFCKVYGKARSMNVISSLWVRSQAVLERDLAAMKSLFIENLESGIKGSPKDLEQKLKRLNHLIHSSPDTATFLMNGSDFLDGLVSCYKLMNPPLRKAIISTSYLSLLGLTEGPNPRLSLLTDQLYSLKAAADSHKAGPTNANDSLVAELVTVTPILKQLHDRIESNETSSSRAKSVISSLENFRKAGGGRPKRLVKRKISKGKGPAAGHDEYGHGGIGEVHIHRMSLITQVQDLFPDLGSRFIMKLLDEYDEDVEQVISHLLEDSLPTHLRSADHGDAL